MQNRPVSKLGTIDESIFKPLRTKRVFEDVSAEIKQMIFSGILKPGDKLPSEIALAGKFGVSRQTVREAIRRLELSGFIRVRKGSLGGPLVVDTILNSIADLFTDAFRMKKIKVDELTKARLSIETIVLKNVFESGDSRAIAAVRKAVSDAERKLEQEGGAHAFEDNILFHKRLALATHNTVLVIVVEAIMAVVAHFHSFLRIGTPTIRNAYLNHKRIIDAIENGDQLRAQAELEKDILHVHNAYRRLNSPDNSNSKQIRK